MPAGNRRVGIDGAGVCTAQGSLADILRDGTPVSAAPLFYEVGRTACHLCRPARGIDPALTGSLRWNALARVALDACGPSSLSDSTLFVGTCNGAPASPDADAWRDAFEAGGLLTGTAFSGTRPPIVSGSCASGLIALWLAHAHVMATGREAVVLAVDILSAMSHTNFDAMRVLAQRAQPPFQAGAEGFVPGEAAVALRLRPIEEGAALRTVSAPRLGSDVGGDGLARLLARAGPCDLLVGQGTGPDTADAAELAAFSTFDSRVPLTSPVLAFGHTLGASGLLGLALAASGARIDLPAMAATDGRPLTGRFDAGSRAIVATRALGGLSAAVGLDTSLPMAPTGWLPEASQGPFTIPTLARLAGEARARRPERPPAALFVHLEHPLEPPARARIGDRLLPSAVLEMTPASTGLVVARAWGHPGPIVTSVGREPDSVDLAPFGDGSVRLTVCGTGQARTFIWDA